MRFPPDYNDLLPLVFLIYMGITAIGSSRNYGVRYVLPLAPLAIVWVSAIAELFRVRSRFATVVRTMCSDCRPCRLRRRRRQNSSV